MIGDADIEENKVAHLLVSRLPESYDLVMTTYTGGSVRE